MGSLGGISPGGSIAIGIVVGLLSTSVQSLGLTLQRKSHILEDEKGPLDVRRPPHRRRRWQLGMAMFVAANLLGSSVQISTLPLPVLSTLQASGLVFNSICATLILGEPFTRWSLWGTLLVCAGALLIAIFGAIPEPAHNLRELLALLGRRPFVVWMVLQALLVVTVAAATDGLHAFASPLAKQDLRFRFGRGLAYGCISGVLSAHSLLVAKSAVELIIKTIADGDNQFVHWQSWMLVLALVVLALSQLYYLHRGLKLVSTSVLYPLVFCVYNIVAILDGLIYFNQTDLITPLHACLIALGTAILLSGVLALSWRLSDEQHPPAVGQSSLAPGLGLVEDTDHEDEEVSTADEDAFDDEAVPAVHYQTFGSQQPDGRQSPRWAERAEIWGELEDQDAPPRSPSLRRRSTTAFPALLETAPLLAPRRATSGSGLADASFDGEGARGSFRRRRKSTGFPGFTARRPRRKSSLAPLPIGEGTSAALSGPWKLRWWRNRGSRTPSSSTPTLPESRAWPPDRPHSAGQPETSSRPRGDDAV